MQYSLSTLKLRNGGFKIASLEIIEGALKCGYTAHLETELGVCAIRPFNVTEEEVRERIALGPKANKWLHQDNAGQNWLVEFYTRNSIREISLDEAPHYRGADLTDAKMFAFCNLNRSDDVEADHEQALEINERWTGPCYYPQTLSAHIREYRRKCKAARNAAQREWKLKGERNAHAAGAGMSIFAQADGAMGNAIYDATFEQSHDEWMPQSALTVRDLRERAAEYKTLNEKENLGITHLSLDHEVRVYTSFGEWMKDLDGSDPLDHMLEQDFVEHNIPLAAFD